MTKPLPVVLLFFFSFTAYAQQTFKVAGTIADSVDNTPLIGVNIILQHTRDTARIRGAVTDVNGQFEFTNVRPGGYLLKLSYIGYTTIQHRLFIRNSDVVLNDLKMSPSVTTLIGIEIVGEAIPVEQKGDTVQYNASAFKTNPDASAEDLITKMPGITVDAEGVKAQGENVRQILVDGKRFFGDDANIALRNLPAEIIDKIEVFDRMSEQSQFTGFDDGQTQKTINIVTKKGMNRGQFGKVNVGAGENGRYLAGGNLNSFKGNRKITFLGMSNNVNQQNFSTEDLLGVNGNGGNDNRGRGGNRGGGSNAGPNFLVGPQKGIATTHSAGINYSNEWGKKVELTGSYFFNTAENERITNLSRTFIARDSGMIYVERNRSLNSNTNHRLNFRLEYNIDSANSLIITPRLSAQLNNANAQATSFTAMEDNLRNALNKTNRSDNTGYSIANNILFRHRFAKRGRSFSWGLNMSVNDREGESELHSVNEFFNPDRLNQIDQQSDQVSNSRSFSSNVAYTEPVGKHGQLQLNYTASLTKSDSDKRTYDLDSETEEYANLNNLLTNIFENNYTSHRGGVSYRYNVPRKYNVMTGLNFQQARLSSAQDFPRAVRVERTFQNVLPQMTFNYRFSQGENVRIIYRTSTNEPSIAQLQNVVNNSNPLFIRSGNTNLKQNYQQTLSVRYGRTNVEKSKTFLFFINGGYVQDYIGNATFFNAGSDTTIVNQVEVAPGQQLTYPINVPDNWNGRTFVTYGMPLRFIKSNLNLNTGFNYNRTPAVINDATNLAHNYGLSQGVVVSSNISKNIDFTLSYTANYTIVKNSIQGQSDNNYFTHLTSLRLICQPWKGLVFNSNVTNSLFSGLSSEFNQSIWFWNAAVGYKLLKNRSLEAKINAFDLLNQNKSINRDVTEIFIEDSQTNVLTRYLMLTLAYTFRKV